MRLKLRPTVPYGPRDLYCTSEEMVMMRIWMRGRRLGWRWVGGERKGDKVGLGMGSREEEDCASPGNQEEKQAELRSVGSGRRSIVC